ncbi:MAG: hypothetical protein H0X02_07765, partial [Nitrosomonas sp.]|nr:hypothetical protein [Nitrosomonas sp.]
MNDEKASEKITLSVEDDEFEERKVNCMNDNLERVKYRIREVFPQENYERLVNYAAQLFIEGSLMNHERRDFFNAMLAIELTRADHNKEEEEYVKLTFNNNALLKTFTRVDSYKTIFH